MQVIDFHTHIHPSAIAEKATNSVLEFYGLKSCGLISTAETLLERDRLAGISHSVILPVALKPTQVRSINNFIIDEAEKHSEFIGFGTVHAEMESIGDEVDFIKASGLHGIKIHPDTQRFNIDDERLFPMYEAASGKLMVITHCGDPRFDFSHPRRLKKVLELFPNLTVIGAHFGGWEVFDEAYQNLYNKNCFLDTSSALAYMPKEKAEKLIGLYGAERLLFGSDFPVCDPADELGEFLRLNLSDEAKEKILCKNALQLLKNI